MGLKIYAEADPSTSYSTEGDFTNPIAQTFDGTTGTIVYRKFYLRNDNLSRWYEDITLQPDASGSWLNGTNGFSWKLIAGDPEPLEAQWELLIPANEVSLGDIGSAGNGDASTYLPFWIRMEVPQGAPVALNDDMTLVISATEHVV